MAITPDTTETFVMEFRAYKATTQARRGILSGRCAFVLDGVENHLFDEYSLSPSSSKVVASSVANFFILRCLATGLTFSFTDANAHTVTLPLNKLIVITSPVTNLTINNTNSTGSNLMVSVCWA